MDELELEKMITYAQMQLMVSLQSTISDLAHEYTEKYTALCHVEHTPENLANIAKMQQDRNETFKKVFKPKGPVKL